MRIAKLCLVFLAIASCALIRSTYQTAPRPDFLFTLWAIACNAATCLLVDVYFRRSMAGRLSMGPFFAATALPTLGLILPMAIFTHDVGMSAWPNFLLAFCAMMAGLIPVCLAWHHWALWIISGGTVTRPPNLARDEDPNLRPPFEHWGWKTCKLVTFSIAAGLILWALTTDSGTSLYGGLGAVVIAWASLWLAGTFFRRSFYGDRTEKLYLAELSFSLVMAICFIPLVFHSYFPSGFTPGTILMLFSCFAAGGPALMALLVQMGQDIQKSSRPRETPVSSASDVNPTPEA